MLKLKRIQLINFLSHAKTEIDFSQNQRLLIDGKSGSGKSSIIDALIWAFYNRGRVDSRSLIKRGEKSAAVTVDLEGDGKAYQIKRQITTKGKHDFSIITAEVTGAEPKWKLLEVSGIKNQQDYLEQKILKSSYLLFINSVIWPQDNSESFVKQSAVKRKEILLEIARAADYDEYYEKTKQKILETLFKKDSSLRQKTEIEFALKQNKEKASLIPDYKNQCDKYREVISVKKEDLEDVIKKESSAIIIDSKLNDASSALRLLNGKISSVENEIFIAESNLGRISDEKIENDKKLIEGLDENKKELAKLKNLANAHKDWRDEYIKILDTKPVTRSFDEGDAIERQIEALDSKKIDLCPELEKPCPVIVQEKENRKKELNERLNRLNEDKEQFAKDLISYQNKIKELGDEPKVDFEKLRQIERHVENLEKIKDKIQTIAQTNEIERKTILSAIIVSRSHLDQYKKEKKELESVIETLNTQIIDTSKLSLEKNRLKRAIEDETINLENSTVALREAENASKNALEEEKKLKTIEDTLKDTNELLGALESLKEAFGSNGIKAIMIDYIIPRLEDKINEILGKLSNFRIKLETQKNTISGESVTEGLFIKLYNENGEEFDFASYSGGEKMKIIMAITEGLADVQNMSFRVLDEAIIGLDEESVEKFVETILTLQERFSQFICISHVQKIKDLFSEKVEVVKINGNSKIT